MLTEETEKTGANIERHNDDRDKELGRGDSGQSCIEEADGDEIHSRRRAMQDWLKRAENYEWVELSQNSWISGLPRPGDMLICLLIVCALVLRKPIPEVSDRVSLQHLPSFRAEDIFKGHSAAECLFNCKRRKYWKYPFPYLHF